MDCAVGKNIAGVHEDGTADAAEDREAILGVGNEDPFSSDRSDRAVGQADQSGMTARVGWIRADRAEEVERIGPMG